MLSTEQNTEMNAVASPADLTSQQRAFALLVAQGSPLTAAYRQAYDVGDDTKPKTVGDNASRLAALPAVADHIAYLANKIEEKSCITAAQLRVRQHAIAHAPALTHSKVYNCRYCSSDGRHYAWCDVDEFSDAVEAWDAGKRLDRRPSPSGGFRFDPFAPPSLRCRRCRGVGERFVYGPLDTTQLDPELAASYRGSTVDPRTGTPKIIQADVDAALRELTAMTPGGYAPKQSESKAAVEHTHRLVPAELTVEEARAALARHRRAPVTIDQATAVITQETKDSAP